MRSDLLEDDVVFDRRQLLGAAGDERLGNLRGICFLGGLPLKIRPFECIVYTAHISRSFRESTLSITGVMVLCMLFFRVRLVNSCIAGNGIVNG